MTNILESWIRDSLMEQGNGIDMLELKELSGGRFSITFYDQDMYGNDYYTPEITFDGTLEGLGDSLETAFEDYDVETEAEHYLDYAKYHDADLEEEVAIEGAKYVKNLLKSLWQWFYYGRKS